MRIFRLLAVCSWISLALPAAHAAGASQAATGPDLPLSKPGTHRATASAAKARASGHDPAHHHGATQTLAHHGAASAKPVRTAPTTHHHPVAAHGAAPVPPPAPVAPVAAPAPPPAPPKGSDSGLPLPRFAALRSDQVSLRAGPGTRYPIDWVYQRRYLPVRIEREFEVWRLVSVADGTQGWVHEAMLTGRRGLLITGDHPQPLRATASDDAATIAMLKPGVIGQLKKCPAASQWCQIEVKGYSGWIRRSAFWGTLADEPVSP